MNHRLVTLLAVAALTLPLAARAQEREGGPCKADIEKLCKDVEPGEGRIMKCLQAHKAELSEECREKGATLKNWVKKQQNDMAVCREDHEKFCKDVEPGEGRIIKCLAGHKQELSDACRKTVGEKVQGARKKQEGFKAACDADVKKLCADVEPGEGRILKCLKGHVEEVSEQCKGFVKDEKRAFREKFGPKKGGKEKDEKGEENKED